MHPQGFASPEVLFTIMSDLSITLEALERSAAQLPVSSYFDEAVHRGETSMEELFSALGDPGS